MYVQRMASSCYCTVCVTAIVILKLDITCTCNTCGIRLHVHVLSIIIASSLVYKSSGLVITLMGTVHTHINSNYTHYVYSDTLLTCILYTVLLYASTFVTFVVYKVHVLLKSKKKLALYASL